MSILPATFPLLPSPALSLDSDDALSEHHPLSSCDDDMPTDDAPDRDRLTEVLEGHGLDRRRAEIVARQELKEWDPDEVDGLLEEVAFGFNPCSPFTESYRSPGFWGTVFFAAVPLFIGCLIPIVFLRASFRYFVRGEQAAYRTTAAEYGLPMFASWYYREYTYVKAPRRLVQQSIEETTALCVNRSGKFKLMDSGYTVMSHVWEETMGWSDDDGVREVDFRIRKRGIPIAHFYKLFDSCNATWVWMDVLAMPRMLEDMDWRERRETEALRVGVINNLETIYSNAERILVLDSLTLQLINASLVDTAVILCLGKWITRMWTLVEARMGRRVMIKTFDGEVDLDAIIDRLNEGKTDQSLPCAGLALSLSTVRGKDASNTGCLLGELVRIYTHAATGRPVDTVRASYPLFGLRWEAGWTRQDGMINLIKNLPEDSPLLAGLYGQRMRRGAHGWAPMSLNGLYGDKTPEQKLTETGIEGRWRRVAISETRSTAGDPQPPGPNVLTFNVGSQGRKIDVVTMVFTRYYVQDLAERTTWGVLRLLFPESGSQFRNFLLVLGDDASELNATNTGQVIGSGFVFKREQWEESYEVDVSDWILR